MKMKAITVQNPWGWALAEGLKVAPVCEVPTGVENRTWRPACSTPLAIHAGKAWDRRNAFRCKQILRELGRPLPGPGSMTYGAVVAVADRIETCGKSLSSDRLRCDCGPWAFPGHWHWRLVNLRRLAEPFECNGNQGLWEVDLPDHLIGAGA